MRVHNDPNSPMTIYLNKYGITQHEFARRLSETIGAIVKQSNVSRWVNGTIPQAHYRAAIEAVTDGEVPADGWGEPRRVTRLRQRRAAKGGAS